MGAQQTVFAIFREVVCCHENCGVMFMLESGFQDRRRKDHKGFHCPNGHVQYYTGDNEEERLKKEIAKEIQRRQWAEASAEQARKSRDRQERRARALKGVITKTKKRVGNGVCPCCNRTFQNLHNHMKSQHPAYKETNGKSK